MDAKASWNKIQWRECEFSGRHALRCYKRRRDSKGDATQRIVQRDFADFSWRWNRRSESSLDGALRKGKRAGLELCAASNPYSGSEGALNRYSASSLDGALCKRDRGWGGRFCGLRGRLRMRMRTIIPKEGPLGAISVHNFGGRR